MFEIKDISRLNAFSLINATYPLAINQTDCQSELDDFASFTEAIGINVYFYITINYIYNFFTL